MSRDTSLSAERIAQLLTKRLEDDGCIGDDEIGCLRDDDNIPPEQWCVNCLASRLLAASTAQEAEIARLKQERDLAIAHDRQPYPTAFAYESACAALATHRARVEELEAHLAALRSGKEGLQEDLTIVRGLYDGAVRIHKEDRAEVSRLAAALEEQKALTQKWVDTFNRSEQFQNGPTKRAEAAEAALETLQKRPSVGDMLCPWCGDPLKVLKPSGGCLVAEVNGYGWHPQCADKFEAIQENA